MPAKKQPKSAIPRLIRSYKPVMQSSQLSQEMSNVVSFDGGNGTYQMANLNGEKLNIITIPHARTRLYNTGKVSGEMATQEVPFAHFDGVNWGYGDEIFRIPNATIDTHQSSQFRYGDTSHVFFALLCAAKLGIPNETQLRLVVTVPPEYYEEVKDDVKKGFEKGQFDGGWWAIALSESANRKGELQTLHYKFKSIVVMREGEPAWWAYRADIDGNIIDIPAASGVDALSGVIVIGDGGFGTFDQYAIDSGKLILESLKGSTDPNGGIRYQVARPILTQVKDKLAKVTGIGANWLNESYADTWIRGYMSGRFDDNGNWCEPMTEEAATITINNLQFQLKPVLSKAFQDYAAFVVQSKVDAATRGIMNAYMPIGGSWSLIDSTVFNSRKRVNFIRPNLYEHTEPYSYRDLNVAGGIAFLAAYIRRKQPELIKG